MIKKISILIILAAFIAGCSSDDSESPAVEEKISIADADALTTALKIEGSTVIEGNPPAPSTDSEAPVIADIDDQTAITNDILMLPVMEQTGSDVAGVYLKIQGSDSYFDIPASSLANSNGRIIFNGRRSSKNARQQEEVAVNIEIPSNIEPGTFCVSYCVYDAQNRVSNVIDVCVDVLSFGGDNSEFLLKSWEVESEYYKDVYNGQTDEETIIPGETYSDIYTTTLYCEDQTTQQFEITELERNNYTYITFDVNGAFSFENSYYYKDMDYDLSSCEAGIVYDEGTDIEKDTGAWSYNDAAKELTLVYDYTYEYNGVTYTETDLEVYDVALEGGNLKVSSEDVGSDYSYYFEVILKEKN